ncbi:hypothetical protein [Stieleria mannarensis]|uniref:hypothetical protein n=1 Tax=Stieleria mannarensis TaxID=2755585 RepID=UPI00160125C8|nr:hypothetical protein [Rhodopirellula sp. JC639]
MATIISESSNRSAIALQPDDPRPVNDWPMIRIVLEIQHLSIVAIVFVCALAGLEDLGLFELGLESSGLASKSTVAGLATILATVLLTPYFMERFREHRFEPVDAAPDALVRHREDNRAALRKAEFSKVGNFRVRGLALPTHSMVFLGCQRMVIAELVMYGPNAAIELVSITESGRIIVTASVAAKRREPAERSLPGIVVTKAAEPSLEKLLDIHLKKAADAAEQTDSLLVELGEGDVIDVLNYYNRAHHQMQVTSGKRSDEVGPMTYGRFRFPLGIVSQPETCRQVI